jgi:hypothetical protein
MGHYKTYISYVVQKGDQHIHESTIAELSLPKYSFYMDNSSQQVLKWAEEKEKSCDQGEKIIILNFFNVTNVK